MKAPSIVQELFPLACLSWTVEKCSRTIDSSQGPEHALLWWVGADSGIAAAGSQRVQSNKLTTVPGGMKNRPLT